MLELDENSKKLIKIFITMLIILILLILINFAVKNLKAKTSINKEREEYVKELAGNYYNEYYKRLDGNKNSLAKLKEKGLTINLKSLLANTKDPNTSIFFNQDTGFYCNYKETKVTIFPVEPYNQDSYNIKIQLDCDGEE